MRILVMNVNTTASMTETMRQGAQAAARPGTEIVATEPTWGVASVEGYYESYISAASILDRLHELTDPARDGGPLAFDAMIWSGFGEHGRESAMELLDVPVLNITDAAAHIAMLIGRKYGVITTVHRAVGQIEECLSAAGVFEKCAGIHATGMNVLDLEKDEEVTVARFLEVATQCLDDGAEVLLLGCAGLSGLQDRITAELGVPVVDGVACAVKLAEALVDLGLSTSRVCSYGKPLPKDRPGWPMRPLWAPTTTG